MFFVYTVIFFALLNLARYLLIAGSAYYFFWGRPNSWTDQYRIQSVSFSGSQMKTEFRYSVISSLIFGVVLTIAFSDILTQDLLAPSAISWFQFFSELLVLILIHDTYFYWMHRILHHPKLFSKIHKVHHLSRNPSPWAAFSFHPVEAILEIGWIVPMTYVFPFDLWVWAAFGFVIVGINVMGHLGVEVYPQAWKTNPILKYLNFSMAHNQHHSDSKGNYGLYFSAWDRLMGTYSSELSSSEYLGELPLKSKIPLK